MTKSLNKNVSRTCGHNSPNPEGAECILYLTNRPIDLRQLPCQVKSKVSKIHRHLAGYGHLLPAFPVNRYEKKITNGIGRVCHDYYTALLGFNKRGTTAGDKATGSMRYCFINPFMHSRLRLVNVIIAIAR